MEDCRMTFVHGRPITENRPELVLIRHGETAWSRSGQHTGRTDLPLTETGRNEARSISTAVADFDFSHAFASPLQRAWETAGIVGLHPDRDDDLLEWDYGEYEGITTTETARRSRTGRCGPTRSSGASQLTKSGCAPIVRSPGCRNSTVRSPSWHTATSCGSSPLADSTSTPEKVSGSCSTRARCRCLDGSERTA